MALTRRELLIAVSGAGIGLACSNTLRHVAPLSRKTDLSARGPIGADTRTILVCMPETTQTREVWSGLEDELGGDFRLVGVGVEQSTDAPLIMQAIEQHRPAGIVLMNNPTATAYRHCQEAAPGSQFPPAVIVMASFLDGHSRQIRSATGISYEIPLITVVTNLRKLLASPIERIGVVVREPLARFVQRQAELARREQIVVHTETISNDPNASELKRAIRRVKRDAQAVWVLNDDRLLSARLITDAWLPGLNERPWAPTIVGAAALVSPGSNFGTFAMLPDHTALGAQAAGLLFDIADNGWNLPPSSDVQLPLSTTTTIDLVQARERFGLRTDALSKVDRILE